MGDKPRLLDLFCGAGGASMGYHRAGFDVVGVDINPQPRYPFEFIQGDAMTFPLEGFDAIHASPPCQFATRANSIHGRTDHPDLLSPMLVKLRSAKVLLVVENVEALLIRRAMIDPLLLCGLTFGLGVKRHRLFETIPMLTRPCPKGHPGEWISVFGGSGLSRTPKGGQARIDGKHNGRGAYDGRIHIAHEVASEAMGIDWMTRDELSQSIPPAYTEFIGRNLMQALGWRLD